MWIGKNWDEIFHIWKDKNIFLSKWTSFELELKSIYFWNKKIEFESDFKNNQYSQYVDWTGVESKLSSGYFDVGFRDYTNIVMGIWKIFYIVISNTIFVGFRIWYWI